MHGVYIDTRTVCRCDDCCIQHLRFGHKIGKCETTGTAKILKFAEEGFVECE